MRLDSFPAETSASVLGVSYGEPSTRPAPLLHSRHTDPWTPSHLVAWTLCMYSNELNNDYGNIQYVAVYYGSVADITFRKTVTTQRL